MVLKASLISSIQALGFIFLALVPLMAVFALPLAAGIAVYSVISSLMVEDELLLLRFFKSAHRSVWGAVFIFSCCVTIMYIPLTFYIAPSSYWTGKKALFHVAQQQFHQLEAHVLHTPFPGVTFYCSEKQQRDKETHYASLFLALYNRQHERYFFTAQEGFFSDDTLVLSKGCIYTVTTGKHYVARFDQTMIHIAQLLGEQQHKHFDRQAKFLTLPELLFKRSEQDPSADYELYKRIAHIAWIFLFPLLSMMIVLAWGKNKSKMLYGIFCNALLFLISYVSMSLANVYWQTPIVAFSLLFGILAICSLAIGYWYYRRYVI